MKEYCVCIYICTWISIRLKLPENDNVIACCWCRSSKCVGSDWGCSNSRASILNAAAHAKGPLRNQQRSVSFVDSSDVLLEAWMSCEKVFINGHPLKIPSSCPWVPGILCAICRRTSAHHSTSSQLLNKSNQAKISRGFHTKTAHQFSDWQWQDNKPHILLVIRAQRQRNAWILISDSFEGSARCWL